MNTFVIFLALYIAMLFAISWFASSGETEEGFLIAGRDRPWWQIMFSKYAATIGVTWFVSYTAFAYEYGWSMVTLVIGALVGYIIYAYWGAPRILKMSQDGGGFYGMGDLVKHQTGSAHAEKLINIMAALTAFLWVVAPVVGAGFIMEQSGLISYELATLLTVVVVLLYVLFSGFKAVVATDVIQGIVVITLLSVVSYAIYASLGSTVVEVFAVRTIDPVLVFMFLFLGTVVTFATTDRYQLTYAAKDKQTIVKGMAFAFVPVVISALILLVIGNIMYGIDATLVPDVAFAEAMFVYLSPGLIPFMLVLFFAGLMSSVDSALYSSATHIHAVIFKQKMTRRRMQKTIVGIGFAALIAAYGFKSITDLAIFVSVLQVAIAFGMIYLIAGYKNRVRFLTLVYCGLIAVAIGMPIVGPEPILAMFPLVGNIVGALIPAKLLNKVFK